MKTLRFLSLSLFFLYFSSLLTFLSTLEAVPFPKKQQPFYQKRPKTLPATKTRPCWPDSMSASVEPCAPTPGHEPLHPLRVGVLLFPQHLSLLKCQAPGHGAIPATHRTDARKATLERPSCHLTTGGRSIVGFSDESQHPGGSKGTTRDSRVQRESLLPCPQQLPPRSPLVGDRGAVPGAQEANPNLCLLVAESARHSEGGTQPQESRDRKGVSYQER